MITSHNIGHYYLIFSRTNIIFLIPTLVYQKATTFGLWVNANNDTGSVLKILLLNATEFVSFFKKTPCWAEQPLQGMELQEKEAQKIKA